MAGQNVMHNDAFQSLVETSDKWITKRTGISNRHIIEKGSTLRDIGVKSAQQALGSSGTDAKDIDLVIVATSTPDDLFGDAGAIAASIGHQCCCLRYYSSMQRFCLWTGDSLTIPQ